MKPTLHWLVPVPCLIKDAQTFLVFFPPSSSFHSHSLSSVSSNHGDLDMLLHLNVSGSVAPAACEDFLQV
ncbi:hypothetical protein J5N97_010884 [Dioscorea zingiberensis]|uniref:Uncharacterized protein n=1 Tax=Dioscorea zingiberensis TaxID=325984 RepID=A0A9D5D166_9LILI|nr:hypothetical protein J5N97_010884 [Dioscorea zingiberensis]